MNSIIYFLRHKDYAYKGFKWNGNLSILERRTWFPVGWSRDSEVVNAWIGLDK